MTVRAKMRCHNIQTANGNVAVQMGAVYSADPESENKKFSDYTPSASVMLNIQQDKPAAKMFEVGKEYYVDFIEAPVQQ